MEESRRLAYLNAMGVAVWVPRVPARESLGTPVQASLPDPAGMDWAALEAAVAGCLACPLHTTRTRTVFGVGNRSASLLVIGEAPGADEDRAGEPFVDRKSVV